LNGRLPVVQRCFFQSFNGASTNPGLTCQRALGQARFDALTGEFTADFIQYGAVGCQRLRHFFDSYLMYYRNIIRYYLGYEALYDLCCFVSPDNPPLGGPVQLLSDLLNNQRRCYGLVINPR
jgi:hypothetical protein